MGLRRKIPDFAIRNHRSIGGSAVLLRQCRSALAKPARQAHLRAMASLLSLLIGLVALVLMIPALIPLLGWANWLLVPLALFGAGVGSFAPGTGARNFCLAIAAFGMLRLWLGGGIL